MLLKSTFLCLSFAVLWLFAQRLFSWNSNTQFLQLNHPVSATGYLSASCSHPPSWKSCETRQSVLHLSQKLTNKCLLLQAATKKATSAKKSPSKKAAPKTKTTATKKKTPAKKATGAKKAAPVKKAATKKAAPKTKAAKAAPAAATAAA